MLDAIDLVRPALSIARALWWLGWEFLVRTVGWSIGWIIWRVLTMGRFPDAGIRGLDDTSAWAGLLVELTGLAALGSTIWLLAPLAPVW